MTIKILISSSKSMDYTLDKESIGLDISKPIYNDEAEEINSILQKLDISEIKKLMKISSKLTLKTKKEIDDFTKKSRSYPAIRFFSGDIYRGLRKIQWQKKDYIYASENLGIISGLYGYLRPLDTIKKYRLEMEYRIKLRDAAKLTSFWHDKISSQLEKSDIIFNLLSLEYSKAILPLNTNPLIIHPYFFNKYSDGQLKFITIETKVARGLMASWLIKNQVKTIDEMRNFNLDNYHYEGDHLNQITKPIFAKTISN